ncbi:carbohydrate-binding family 9-like protein [Aureispira anguillae]|uniref:Carbohydrate-binding family 9-like protein n=1 Tax=Aureispira anguillae TaxID=2864201 RepID=A0A916DT09_9BACT|nr:carbohydrate-binding family 9-like protein [Aureispira anguillae]BDS12246.1 carbohydrate-binding family 9-like protein [Aureispira anguillae]
MRLTIIGFFLLTSCIFSIEEPVFIDVHKKVVFPKHYIVYKTKHTINLDGKPEEEDWQNASFTEPFIDIEGIKVPQYKTQVKMLWDDQYLYLYAEMEEPHIWGDITNHDAIIFYNNDFEVFIDPTDDTYNYTEIEVNALNTTWDLRLDKPYRFGGKANDYYEIEGLKTAVEIAGTINDPSDMDQYWAVEMAIPLEVILQKKRKKVKGPQAGDYWRVNFSRVQWEHSIDSGGYSRKKVDGKLLPEYNWVWSNQGAINMHCPERWGYIEFTDNELTHKKSPIEIENLLTKQVAYALLEQIRLGAHQKMLDNKVGQTQKIQSIHLKDEIFEAKFVKTYSGFEIYIYNQTLEKEFVINEMGRFKSLQ